MGDCILRLDVENHRFDALKVTGLTSENIFERHDLQKAIINSWDLFRNEIGLPSSYLIGTEIKPHESTLDAIDLLAFNPDDSSLIVIELKRDRNKLQLLQALSYAAMLSNWDQAKLIANINKKINANESELVDLIKSNPISATIKTARRAVFGRPTFGRSNPPQFRRVQKIN
jgi:hypothetical protein